MKRKREKERDIRTLCYSCINDYIYAGYKVKIISRIKKEKCDKCNRMGIECEIK